MQYRVSRVVAGPVLHVLWRPSISGAANVPASGGAILASNHLSVVDSLFLPLMLERPVTFAAKSEYFTGTRLIDRVTAAYLRRTKQLSVDRSEARSSRGMLEAALSLLRAGELFGIYPEGTRSPDGRLYRGRTGVGWLALASGLPVIPVAMAGTDHVLPPGRKIPRLGPTTPGADGRHRGAAEARGGRVTGRHRWRSSSSSSRYPPRSAGGAAGNARASVAGRRAGGAGRPTGGAGRPTGGAGRPTGGAGSFVGIALCHGGPGSPCRCGGPEIAGKSSVGARGFQT